jgi:acetyltransferase-like isoleucine patch superfamily enzyme
MTRKLDNVPQAIFESGESRRGRYQQLMIGRSGWGPLVHYELVMTLAGPMPGALGLLLRSRLFPGLLGRCGRNVFFGTGVVLRHPHKIRIGNNVVIDDGVVLDAKGRSNDGITIGDGVFVGRHSIIQTKDGNIVLEDGVNISSFCSVFSASTVTIGAQTLVASYAYVIGGGHEFTRPDRAVVDQPRPSRGIQIGSHGWIGAGVAVLDGVSIGHGVVVGANAVVTRDLPDFAVAGGIPAAVLRHRDTSSTVTA